MSFFGMTIQPSDSRTGILLTLLTLLTLRSPKEKCQTKILTLPPKTPVKIVSVSEKVQ